MAKRAVKLFCTMLEFAVSEGCARSTPYTWWAYGLIRRRPEDGLVDVEASRERLRRYREAARRAGGSPDAWQRARRRATRLAAAMDTREADTA